MLPLLTTLAASDIFGTIKVPQGVEAYNQKAGGIGLLEFFTVLLRLATIIAGLWVLLNFVLAGYSYITAQGNASAHTDVKNKLTMSVLGIIIIVVSQGAVALLGLIFAGNASFFLNPIIPSP